MPPLKRSRPAVSYRITWPDGDVLYGHLERGNRLSALAIPDEALLAQTAT